ncbi:MAG: LytTR family DNA-binding domain-containing protein [Pseudomonadota bacterium]
MRHSGPELLQRYRPWQRLVEIGYWVSVFLINAVGNSLTEVMDYRRTGDALHAWQPAVWETSSAVAFLLLMPWVVWFTQRCPPSWQHWRSYLAWHALGSVLFSFGHVLLMVALRHVAYSFTELSYSFGDWGVELIYEYLKDARTYAGCVLIIEGYRWILRRLQGEARWLDRAQDADVAQPPTEPAERFLVKMLGREFLVPAAEIDYAQAAGNYVNLYVGRREYPLRSTMKALQCRLDPARFRRVHRSYIVNLNCISEIEPLESGDARIHLRSGQRLPCSRRYRAALAPA